MSTAGPLAWVTAEQLRRERPLSEAIAQRQAEFERVYAEVFRLEIERLWREVERLARPPWWAMAIGWGIAVCYAVGSVRGSQRR